jgi:hypothetical protein
MTPDTTVRQVPNVNSYIGDVDLDPTVSVEEDLYVEDSEDEFPVRSSVPSSRSIPSDVVQSNAFAC